MTDIDPITLEVVTEGLISVVREMRATVFRTARSVAIYEARDFSCGLFDAKGQVVAQSEDIGSHVVPLPWSVESALDDLGDDPFTGLDAEEFLAGSFYRSVTITGKVITDRGDFAVVVGGGERLFEEPVALFGSCGEFIKVGNSDGIARGQFQDRIAGEFHDAGCWRHMFIAASIDFDIVDRDGLATVFEEFEIEVAELA